MTQSKREEPTKPCGEFLMIDVALKVARIKREPGDLHIEFALLLPHAERDQQKEERRKSSNDRFTRWLAT